MEIICQYNEIAAVFIARVFLGLLFFFQGYDAVFNVKIRNVIITYQYTFKIKGIPGSLTAFACWFTALTELAGGFFLIIGFCEYPALYLLGISLVVASIGFGINTPMWDTRFVFPRLVLLLFLLLVPQAWHTWSLDNLLFRY
jgi:uncharacterized membrane protein YphA (DoxX/SURF4 family)